MKIVKRNGEVVQYDVEKIRRAIEKANEEPLSVYEELCSQIMEKLIAEEISVKSVRGILHICKQKKLLQQKIEDVKFIINKSKFLKELGKFAYDIAIEVISSLIATLILTAILIRNEKSLIIA